MSARGDDALGTCAIAIPSVECFIRNLGHQILTWANRSCPLAIVLGAEMILAVHPRSVVLLPWPPIAKEYSNRPAMFFEEDSQDVYSRIKGLN